MTKTTKTFVCQEDIILGGLKHPRHRYPPWNYLGPWKSRVGSDEFLFAARTNMLLVSGSVIPLTEKQEWNLKMKASKRNLFFQGSHFQVPILCTSLKLHPSHNQPESLSRKALATVARKTVKSSQLGSIMSPGGVEPSTLQSFFLCLLFSLFFLWILIVFFHHWSTIFGSMTVIFIFLMTLIKQNLSWRVSNYCAFFLLVFGWWNFVGTNFCPTTGFPGTKFRSFLHPF